MNIILFEAMPDNNIIPLNDERAKHIITVLKLKKGDSFKMGILNKSEGHAEISDISENGIAFTYSEESVPSLYPVTLMVAQVRPICMKRILREAVSLGVERIILTGSDTGEKSYLSSSLYKSGEYREYLLDGAMQSAHAGISNVVFADKVSDAVRLAGNADNLIVLDNVNSPSDLSKAEIKGNCIIAIGPERGWSDKERSIFSGAGYKSMLLGTRVLRTETACSAGVAVLLSRMGLL